MRRASESCFLLERGIAAKLVEDAVTSAEGTASSQTKPCFSYHTQGANYARLLILHLDIESRGRPQSKGLKQVFCYRSPARLVIDRPGRFPSRREAIRSSQLQA